MTSSVVQLRTAAEGVVVEELHRATLETFDGAVPWRRFRWYRGQRHYSGSYWSATMGGLVGYESRLELANLLCEDFNLETVWILAQPFLLEGAEGRAVRRHVPDYLVERPDGTPCVIDVKPSEFLTDPKVARSLDWTAELLSAVGWEYRVLSEPDPVRLSNIRFLAGYRRPFQFMPVETEAARIAIDGPMTVGQAVRAAASTLGSPEYARGIVFHLLWTGNLTADLSTPLQSTTFLEPAS